MKFRTGNASGCACVVSLIDDKDQIAQLEGLDGQSREYLSRSFEADQSLVTALQYPVRHLVLLVKKKASDSKTFEALRKSGAEVQAIAQKQKAETVFLQSFSAMPNAAELLAEGIALANYQFLKYRSDADKLRFSLTGIVFDADSIGEAHLRELQSRCDAIYLARTLVNEPVNFLTAEQLSEEIKKAGADAGFSVEVLDKARIQQEKMGGILAVNMGSIDPPTFTIMEYKPEDAVNEKPVVLVGKGIVYDTGGLSLKPTPASMDRMKSDMSGAALVTAVMYAAAKSALPLHLIALVPATDNRPGGNAYTPGDVITMYSGKTVEVLNTDAEGRLVLGDALHWAKRYEPELVMDFATLTGAASAAVGEHGIVCMGTADADVREALAESGERQYERLVPLPLWDEYGDQIKSDVADIKNVGGPTGGAITAGKFLEHFTDYPWMHFDIAGVSFSTSKKGYLTSGGTGYGIRMVLDFLHKSAGEGIAKQEVVM